MEGMERGCYGCSMELLGIVLASTSRYRRELFARLGLPFEVAAPAFEEATVPAGTHVGGEEALLLALEHARGKARSLASTYPRHLIVASDQVCECEGRILDKAGSADRAREQLAFLAGREHRLHTAVVIADTRAGVEHDEVVTTRARMRSLDGEEIARYVELDSPLDSAGSYYSEGLGVALFERFTTEDPTAIIGLPLIAVRRLLSRCGVEVLRPETWPRPRSGERAR